MDTAGKLTILGNQKGIALVYIAIVIVVLMGCLGLAVDVGHLQLVRGQLQNAADAAALAGAAQLYVDPSNPGPPTLDFTRAQEAARNFINQNKSDGVALQTGDISVGYWDLIDKNLQPATIAPVTGRHVPAVVAKISREGNNNGGPVDTFFTRVLGETWRKIAVSSRDAVAVSGFPASAPAGELFPMTISNCMTDHILSLPESEWPNPMYINSPYLPGGADCFSGQWTSFKLDTNDVPTIRNLMESGNPDPLQVGDNIWIEPGAEGTLYQTDRWEPPLPPGGKDVVLAVVDTAETDLKTKGERTITGFAVFHIDGATGGSDKVVYGHLVSFSTTYPTAFAGSSPGGPESNIVTPPLMVQ